MTNSNEKMPVAPGETVQEKPGEVAGKAAPAGKSHAKHEKSKEALPDAKLSALENQVVEAQKKNEELQETLLRTAAEYENYRKRSQKENAAAFGDGVSHAVTELLPIIDVLEAAANAETADAEYKKGVLLTLAKCEEVFKKLGICEIDALDKPFDPALHNAVMQEAKEGVASGTVTQVIQKGYALGDKVIRHAMVAVAP